MFSQLPSTAAVVVAWREAEITRHALASLQAMSPAANQLVFVVQEWSPEELADLRQRMGNDGVVVDCPENVGFSEAANIGVEQALALGAEWVLLVNNDATVSTDCLGRCVAEATRRPKIAVLGPAVVFDDESNRIWYAGGTLSRRGGYTRHPGVEQPASELPPGGPTGYVPGCCALVSAAAWREVGPYRTDFFLYFEDAEWCERARRAGWTCWYLAEVLCRHAVSVTAGKRGSLGLTATSAYYLARNPLRAALETPSPGLRLTRVLGVLGIWGAYNALRVARARSTRVAAAYLRGTFDAFAGRMGKRAPDPA
jgi:GT2 family glycosyltransferase